MRGQINIAATLIGLGAMALTAFGFYTASNVRTDSKIGSVQKEVFQISERAARLETSVPAIQQDIRDIKDSIKKIESYLKPINVR